MSNPWSEPINPATLADMQNIINAIPKPTRTRKVSPSTTRSMRPSTTGGKAGRARAAAATSSGSQTGNSSGRGPASVGQRGVGPSPAERVKARTRTAVRATSPPATMRLSHGSASHDSRIVPP
jgi:hypothetical protein